MTEKVNVIGSKSHPFFKWAKENHGIGQFLNGISTK